MRGAPSTELLGSCSRFSGNSLGGGGGVPEGRTQTFLSRNVMVEVVAGVFFHTVCEEKLQAPLLLIY